jgi:nucleotide-binding universal stress UspA family protein
MKTKPTRSWCCAAFETTHDEPVTPAGHESEKAMVPLLKIRRILVPIDFSSCSKKALEYAIPFAKQFGARLYLLYVGQGYYLVPELAGPDFSTNQFSQRADAAAKLATFATKEIPATIAVDLLVRNGQPALEIDDVAKEISADLIIISTHGYTGVKHLWFGSIAEQVARHANCPVLVVRESEHEFLAEEFCTEAESKKAGPCTAEAV